MKSRVKKCRPVRYGSGGKRQQQRRGWGDGNDDGGRKRQRQRGSELMASADSGTTTLTRQNVVVTGSTRGLGRALVLEFLKAGDRVCVSSRNEDDVRKSVQSLEKDYGDAVSGKKCDVSIAKDVEKLATCAAERGNIDIWIANAASNAYLFEDLEAFPTDELKRIVDTNSLGTLLQCRQAIRSMKGNGGHIFLLEGAGADGQGTSKFAAYGATKAGTLQLARSLNEELRGSNVSVHSISPGLVYTELIDAGKSSFGSVGRLAVNTLAETPETVAATLVPKIKEFASKDRNIFFATLLPSRIEFLTIPMAATKFIERLLFGKNKDRFNPE